MAKGIGNRPAEIFGYPLENQTTEAQQTRERYWCPFVDKVCNKRSGFIDFPFGVCSVEHHGQTNAICPRRFEEPGSLDNVSRVLEDVARHYFGDFNNVIPFSEVKLPKVGTIDYVLVRHKPLKAEVEDFVAVEFQTDSTTDTGQVVKSLQDFLAGQNVSSQTYRFALYNLIPQGDRLTLQPSRIVSTTVDEVYQAMRNNPGLPNKDVFMEGLNAKLVARLSVNFE